MQLTWKQWRWILLWAANIVIIFAVWFSVSGVRIGLGYTPTLLAISRLGGLLAMYCLLVQLWLIGRSKLLEADFGLDRLTRIHRWNGFAAVLLVLLHVPTLLAAYAPVYGVPIPQVLPQILQTYEDTTKALIAEILLFIVAGTSLMIARRRLKYEWWYYIHLATYIIIILAVGHQFENGRELVSVPWFRAYWYALIGLSALSILYYRFIMPFWKWNKHRFRVRSVESIGGNVFTIHIAGRDVEHFAYRAGQFAKVWFVARGFWIEDHPFTIALEPGNDEIRISYKVLGDFTAKLEHLPKGTPVVVDGPYGRFTLDVARTKKLVMIAGGIGITPFRAMLGELAKNAAGRKIELFYSVKNADEFVLLDELKTLLKTSGGTLHTVVSEGKGKADVHGMLTADVLKDRLGSLDRRDFYICGPPPMMQAIQEQLRDAGVEPELIHTEQFSLIKS